jgi:hypothetical protein
MVSRDDVVAQARQRQAVSLGDDPTVRRLRAELPPEMGGCRQVDPARIVCYRCSALGWLERQARGDARAACTGLRCEAVA